MGAPSSKFYTFFTMLFHKYGGVNVGVTNCMSQFSMFVQTKSNVGLSNGKMVHAQVIEVNLFRFLNCPIIYPLRPVYYCPGHPSNTISLVVLKFHVGFQKVTSEPL